MYQQPGDPNQQNQGPYYPPDNPQWANTTTPSYPPVSYPSGTDQPSYAPPPPGFYPPQYPTTQPGTPPYNPYGYQQPTYPGTPSGPGMPNFPQPQQPRKSKTRLIVIIAAMLVCVIAAGVIGAALAHQNSPKVTASPTATSGSTPSTSGSTPSPGGNTPTASGATPTTQTSSGNAQVGQTLQAGTDYAVTVNSVKTSAGDNVFHPATGNTYIVIDVTVKNTSSAPQVVSSLLNFELQDSTGQKYDEAITDIGSAPDQTGLQPGKLIRGQLVYEVPQSTHQFTL